MASKVVVRFGSLLLCLALTTASACTSSKDEGPEGAPVPGAADNHCDGKPVQVVDPAACKAAPVDAGPPAADAGPPESEYGPTQYGGEGDDDHCKYHIKWSISGARKTGGDATFHVTATYKIDGKPLTGAKPRVELYLNEFTPAPNSDQKPTETAPGVYDVGPLKFDAAGNWIARFHFNEHCNDGEPSPHGHAAFFVGVP